MAQISELSSWCLILSGCGFLLTGAIGILRMPDFYTRLHAAGLTDTMGAGLLLAGLLLQTGFNFAGVKLVLAAAFVIFTSPIATHALINAAYHAKIGMGQAEARASDPAKAE
ncbi:MAG: monovalent cation/H(+) antiporter subunit G [Alphaproteobacteria bacterium]